MSIATRASSPRRDSAMTRRLGLVLILLPLAVSAQDSLDDLLGAETSPPAAAPALPPSAAPVASPAPAPDPPPADTDGTTGAAIQAKGDAAAAPANSRRLGPSTIEEIVVTAQKREESINTVPISISAFTGEDLKALGVNDTRDLANLVPGFSYGDSGYGVPIYSLRGVGFNDPSQTASSTVGVYSDEFNLPFPVFTKGANLDIRRVEILKGPQGTLYGRNTTGGLINYIANRPGDQFETGTTASYGRFKTFDTESHVSGPLTSTLGVRLAYRGTFSDEGWQYSNTRPGDTIGKQNKQSARLTLDWSPDSDFKTSLVFSGWLDHGQPQAPQAIGLRAQNAILGNIGLTESVRNYPLVPFDTNNNRVADWAPGLDYHLNEQFGMVAARSDWNLDSNTTASLLASYGRYHDGHSVLPQSGLDTQNAERELLTTTSAISLETRLSGKWREVNNWLIGGFYAHDKVNDFQVIYTGTDTAGFPLPISLPIVGQISAIGDRIDSLGSQTGDTLAAFANADWQLLNNFKLDAGVRYTDERRRFAGCIADDPNTRNGVGLAALLNAVALAQPLIHPGTPIPTQFAGRGDCASIDPVTNDPGQYRGKLPETNLSYRTALNWTPLEDQLLYVSYSRGYKSGSFPVLPSSSQAQYAPVVQERLDAFELGGKTTFWERRLRANFAGFYYDYRNKQLIGRVNDPVFGPLPILVNVPRSRVIGGEAELQSSPFEGLFVGLNATYLATRIGHYSGIDESGNLRGLTGRPFNFAPRFGATAIINYSLALTATGALGLGADYSYRSATNSVLTGDPLNAIPDYDLVNAHVDWKDDAGWSVGLYVRNLFDRFYTVGSVNTGDAIARFTGLPRTYGITASYALH